MLHFQIPPSMALESEIVSEQVLPLAEIRILCQEKKLFWIFDAIEKLEKLPRNFIV